MARCPKGFFCIRNYNILILIIILIILIILIYKQASKKSNYIDNEPQKIIIVKNELTPPERHYIHYQPEPLKSDPSPTPVEKPELKPSPAPDPDPVKPEGMAINIKTRQEYPYQQLGIISKQNTLNSSNQAGDSSETFVLPLYGRQLYWRSQKYNYYTTTDSHNNIKIPININGDNCTSDRGCTMINDGDLINIPELNGIFKASIYNLDAPRYIPF